jgi:curli biogenesis system outer membrane secretion channel CsgG
MLNPALALGLLLSASGAAADYLAYAVDDGSKTPLPETVDDLDAKDLLNMEWGEYSGPKSRIGVLPVDNTSSAASFTVSGPGGTQTVNYNFGGNQVPVNGIEAILTDVLLQSGRFRLVERTELASMIQEQDLGASGRVAKPSAAKVGQILGAQYLIQAVVTNYEDGTSGRDVGVGGLLGGRAGAVLGGVGIKNKKSVVGMNFRLVDATTSEVVFSKQVESVIKEQGLSFGGGGGGWTGGAVAALGGFMSQYSKTPVGQAVIAAVNKGAYELAKQIGTAPAEGSVVKAGSDGIYLNLGQDATDVGETFAVLSVGEELIDPETGISLGAETETIGTIRVREVKAKYSIADPVDVKVSRISNGDKVRSTMQASGLQFGPEWKKKKRGLF